VGVLTLIGKLSICKSCPDSKLCRASVV